MVKIILILVIALIVALVVAIIKIKKISGKEVKEISDTKAAPSRESDQAAIFSSQISALTDLLLKAKLRGVKPEITGLVENIIRILIVVLPKASRYKGTELAWVSGRLADVYIPDLVNPYIQLSESGRTDKNADLMDALGDIQKKLDEIDKALDTGDTVSFDSEVRYLRGMISSQSIEVNQ